MQQPRLIEAITSRIAAFTFPQWPGQVPRALSERFGYAFLAMLRASLLDPRNRCDESDFEHSQMHWYDMPLYISHNATDTCTATGTTNLIFLRVKKGNGIAFCTSPT
eukprot:scaffold167235_cov31-Tisochrysis_lutea.AAC.1